MQTMTNSAASRPPISILTFVLQQHHCQLLEDWFDFFDHPVARLIVHVGSDARIPQTLADMCAARNIGFTNLGISSPDETTDNEQALLTAQFDAIETGLACVIRLDTLPFKAEGVRWQDDAFNTMASDGACYITGATRPYRADKHAGSAAVMLTQRLSNCFLIIAPDDWRRLQQGTQGSAERYGRFLVEGAAEDFLAERNLWGLRLLNRPELRIFHCQEWSTRILKVRRSFRAGKGIKWFMKGYEDDFFGARAKNYMQPGPPPLRQLRITLGAWRRKALTLIRNA